MPAETGEIWCTVPSIIHRLLDDLPLRPAYVLNLRWDVLAWNPAADKIFSFSTMDKAERNLLWMAFTSERMRNLLQPWDDQALQMLSSFRRGDYVKASKEGDVENLVKHLLKTSDEFKTWWAQHEIHGPCQGTRYFMIEGLGSLTLEHTSLTVDVEKHLRLVYYTPDDDNVTDFENWLKENGSD